MVGCGFHGSMFSFEVRASHGDADRFGALLPESQPPTVLIMSNIGK
jgi:hypothetical protein